jgi:ATP/maltotriose-dependent transcriptional regulator MalT
VLQEALNYSRSIGHAPSIAEIALAIGTQLGNQPRTESVLASRLEALGAIPPGDDGVYLDALIGVADAYMNRGDAERALEFLARAEKGVNAAPYATRARYCMARGATYAVVGEPEAALQNIREAVACSEKTSDMKLPVWAQLNLCHYATMIGHVDVATASAASASPMALESGSSALVVYAHALAAEALFLGGDVALAAERTSMAIEAMRATEAARLSSLVAICALTTGRHRGKNAVPLLGRFDDDALLESAFRSEEPWWIGNLTAALIDWRMQSSSRQGLTLLLHRAVNSIASVALCPRLAFIVATIGSEGDIGRMRSLVARWAAGDGNEYGGACKALFEATLTAREGLPAEEAALAAAEAFAQQRIPLLRAKALEVAGRLDEAALEYQLCGAIADAKRLAPARAPIAPSATLRDTLSAREREVADVLLKGHSNREIADLLHISERTVESHVRTILSKAGVRSRFELAMALVEDGRFDGGGSADSVPAS